MDLTRRPFLGSLAYALAASTAFAGVMWGIDTPVAPPTDSFLALSGDESGNVLLTGDEAGSILLTGTF
jgi:hypothetical protein